MDEFTPYMGSVILLGGSEVMLRSLLAYVFLDILDSQLYCRSQTLQPTESYLPRIPIVTAVS